jgi:hypothetical protein
VHGTVRSIADRCDGAPVHVTRETVVVIRHIIVTVHAGHSHLARARTSDRR